MFCVVLLTVSIRNRKRSYHEKTGRNVIGNDQFEGKNIWLIKSVSELEEKIEKKVDKLRRKKTQLKTGIAIWDEEQHRYFMRH